ncbi:MAG: alpha/beta hydrolase fold domain-containing protein, partial [Pseudomonadales bacterium]
AIAYQLLIYPATDAAMDTPSQSENAEGYLLTKDSMVWFWNHYLGKGDEHRTNPYAAPAHADNLAGLPPACIITAEFDPLRDEGEAYAKQLKAAGVPTVVQRFDSMIHGFFGMTDLLAGSREAMTLAAGELKKALN